MLQRRTVGNHVLVHFTSQFVDHLLQTTHVFSKPACSSTCAQMQTLLFCTLLGLRHMGMSSSIKTCITDFLILAVYTGRTRGKHSL